MALLPTGMTNRELGEHLYLSQNTIKSQLRRRFSKLNVRNPCRRLRSRGGLLGEQRSRRIDADE